MQQPYPSIEPYATYELSVDAPHVLYVEELGNPKGLPVVFLHGGPGAGCNPDQRRFFDPSRYRIILFDQRGSGRSRPHAELEKNTTQALVSDMETIRRHLKVDRWVVFGGSWGSTLGLIYAEMHPDRVISLVMRGIFLCRQKDFDWFYEPGGASWLFPDAYEPFIGLLSPDERKQVIESYYRRLTSPDEKTRIEAAIQWSGWEGRTATLLPDPSVVSYFTEPHLAVSLARIEAHYFINNIFLEPNYILNNVHKLDNIPGYIVHGRYDMCCPVENAYLLHKAWPKAKFEIIPDAGHSAKEPGILDALIRATREIADQHG